MRPWHDVSPGKELPRDFQALIEIPLDSNVKYELDKASRLLRVDRIIHSAVFYPANYGFIPQNYAEENDPLATNDPEFSDYLETRDLPPHRLLVLRRFFQDYKQLEGKQVQVEDIKPAYAALMVIEKALARYQQLRDELIAGEPH